MRPSIERRWIVWIEHVFVMFLVMAMTNLYAWLRADTLPTWGLFLAGMVGLLLSKSFDKQPVQ